MKAKKAKGSGIFPVRIPEEIKKEAQKKAKEENRSLSNLIITALIEYLKHEK